MKIDWQAFEDGVLDAEHASRAAADPMAKGEVEGLRAFRRAVREAAMQEPVPRRRLEAALRATVARPSVGGLRLKLAACAACLSVLAFGVVVYRQLAPVPQLDQRREFDSFDQAVAWAEARSGIDVPAIPIVQFGEFHSAHAYPGKSCFDFSSDGRLVHVAVAKGDVVKAGCQRVDTGEGEFYVHELSKDVSFVVTGLVFDVKGGTEETNMQVAKSLLVSLSSSR